MWNNVHRSKICGVPGGKRKNVKPEKKEDIMTKTFADFVKDINL